MHLHAMNTLCLPQAPPSAASPKSSQGDNALGKRGRVQPPVLPRGWGMRVWPTTAVGLAFVQRGALLQGELWGSMSSFQVINFTEKQRKGRKERRERRRAERRKEKTGNRPPVLTCRAPGTHPLHFNLSRRLLTRYANTGKSDYGGEYGSESFCKFYFACVCGGGWCQQYSAPTLSVSSVCLWWSPHPTPHGPG